MQKAEKFTLRIAMADEQSMFRAGLRQILTGLECQVVCEAANGIELIAKIATASELPHICVLDVFMAPLNGFETVKEIKKRWPGIAVLVLTTFEDEFVVARMMKAGANGYLLKSSAEAELKEALRAVHTDGFAFSDWFTMELLSRLHNESNILINLSEKEKHVLHWCCSDLTYEEIAITIGTSRRNVENTRDRLFEKFRVRNRVRLALLAVRYGFVSLEGLAAI
jgi:DNA-binding NarL/FixJ family response regulator